MTRPRTRPRTRHRASLDLDLPRLSAPWEAYLRARRRAWTTAAHIERRYFRTQDYAQYVNERLSFTRFVDKATRTWTAAVLRAYSGAHLEAVGSTGSTKMPGCFLVRVPKKDSIELIDHICGAVRPDDAQGQERLRQVRSVERGAREIAARERTRARLYAKMMAAATTARERGAQRGAVLHEREACVDPARRLMLARASYAHGREYTRRWQIARKYEARLMVLGYAYDLATLAAA